MSSTMNQRLSKLFFENVQLWVTTLFLFVSSAAACTYLVFYAAMRDHWPIFLLWNLFLAWIPLGIAFVIRVFRVKRVLFLLPMTALWLLFFPNAPYILTDIIHFRWIQHAIWLNWTLFLTFALIGLFVGFASLRWMHENIAERYGSLVGWGFVSSALVANGFGIYIGRFLRWNSWDIVSQPEQLILGTASHYLSDPTWTHAWGLSFVFALLVGFCYIMICLLSINDLRPRDPWTSTAEPPALSMGD